MGKEREVLGLLKVISEQMLQMDGRLTRIEERLERVEGRLGAIEKDVAAIKAVTQLIPRLVTTVDDLHNTEIGRSGLFTARA